ncbi:GAP family protein [Mycobacterium shinjukuense]|uniref:Membrane protein n=1 Tax=Mycobacterium shinjukuense TaxID=398694 RepID=A0A7I7MVZ6_9MYCO|nr:GAP family protein [Mycobacterium shinjukuense]MCV6987586.1 GAP family protein [Mycobacterium shinjukuense]BBX76057.1 membrane protein [Mycobacterium shinjukuense]
MTANWATVLAGLIPLALVIAVSPLSIIPAVLVLHASRPRPTGLAFLGGWLLGLAALTAVFVGGSGMFGGLHKAPPAWASWLRVVLGSALVAFGVYRWLTRHGRSETPKWMRSFATITPRRAGITGTALAVVRPEVFIICLAAGVAIGTSGLAIAGKSVCAAGFVVVSASTAALPIVAYVAGGDRLGDTLDRLKDWMEKNHAAMVAVVLVLLGLMVLYNGITAL